MKARFDAGTDVAMIGVWDAHRDSTPLTAAQQHDASATLNADAAAGHLFLVHTGGDGGGPVDVYVDEAIPAAVRERLVPLGLEPLLDLPSGRLIVDGAEYYRSPRPHAKGMDPSVAVPAGVYSVRCYSTKDLEQPPMSEEALRQLVGSTDLAYYDRVNQTGCLLGASTLLLFPILAFPLGWKVALVLTTVVFLSFFPARQWLLKRNARYQRLDKVVPAFRLASQDAAFVLELRRLESWPAKGGTVSA